MFDTQEIASPATTSFITKQRKDVFQLKNEIGPKYVIFMVGLPARGKSYICKKLAKYLSWCGFNTRVFNVGNRRRVMESPVTNGSTQHDAKFFDAENQDAAALREKLALDTLDELLEWLRCGGKVAIHDATNSTMKRRLALRERALREPKVKVLFIESICPDPVVLEQNIRMKLSGPDYAKMDPQKAMQDFKSRIANYEKVYQTLSEEEEKLGVSYIKLIDVGAKVIAHHIKGYLPSQCVFYLMQMNIVNRTIWLSRHGESTFNVMGKIGGNPSLSPLGKEYAQALYNFMEEEQGLRQPSNVDVYDSIVDVSDIKQPKLRILTSCLERAVETAQHFDPDIYDVNHVRFLNEIYCGSFEEMTHSEIKEKYPQEFDERMANPLLYRYPGTGGESLVDVIERLRPVIIELERMRIDVLVVSHQVVMKTLLSYFSGLSLHDLHRIQVPLHTLYKLEPKPYGSELTRYHYNPDTKRIEFLGTGVGDLLK